MERYEVNTRKDECCGLPPHGSFEICKNWDGEDGQTNEDQKIHPKYRETKKIGAIPLPSPQNNEENQENANAKQEWKWDEFKSHKVVYLL